MAWEGAEAKRDPNGLQLRIEIFTYQVSTSVLTWLVFSNAGLDGPSFQQSEKWLDRGSYIYLVFQVLRLWNKWLRDMPGSKTDGLKTVFWAVSVLVFPYALGLLSVEHRCSQLTQKVNFSFWICSKIWDLTWEVLHKWLSRGVFLWCLRKQFFPRKNLP